MKPPSLVTFTGIDDKTDLQRVCDLSVKYPIEWGILVGGRIGKMRYPSETTIEKICALQIRRSLHLCGSRVSMILAGYHRDPSEYAHFTRVQVNARNYDIPLISVIAASIQKPVIVQWRELEFPPLTEHVHYLFDRSGGRGAMSDIFPQMKYMPFSATGYAGGITPDNVTSVVKSLNADCHYWLDMESGVRANDLFDLDKCEAVCKTLFG